ncbi:MAG TPA: hypothetical protein VI455_16440 [Terriglobia bacterium]
MLRITLVPESEPTTLRVEGKLSGPWVHELEHSWDEISKCKPTKRVTVELSDVTFVSSEGRELLRSLLHRGADLQSRSLMTRFILGQVKIGSNEGHKTTKGG